MALPSLLLQSVNRRVQREIPDERLQPYGGFFGAVVPDVETTRRELTEYDTQVTQAAPVVALGAPAPLLADKPNLIVDNRTVQFIGKRFASETDLEWLSSFGDNPSATARAAMLSWLRGKQEKNMESVKTTRGYLIASMIVGEISWAYLGINLPNVTFRMPGALKLTPTNYWRDESNNPNVNATPITDITEADFQAGLLGGGGFNRVGMSRTALRAMTATTEYQNQARAVTTFALTSNLPVFGTDQYLQLASRVLGKDIVILDQVFNQEPVAGGDFTQRRFIPERITVLWRKEDENSSARWKFSNVPLLKSVIASAVGSDKFNGVVSPGPLAWSAADEDDFNWLMTATAQEGIGTRIDRTVTAVIYNKLTGA
jgi:hypothetical protein